MYLYLFKYALTELPALENSSMKQNTYPITNPLTEAKIQIYFKGINYVNDFFKPICHFEY